MYIYVYIHIIYIYMYIYIYTYTYNTHISSGGHASGARQPAHLDIIIIIDI